MATGATAGSDPFDSLAHFSVSSLFPPSFGVPQNVTGPYDLERELDSLHSHLGTIALRSPKKLFNEAKSILENCSELLNNGVQSKSIAVKQHELDVAKAMDNPRNRRPGLGIKRSRFSLKPDSSQPALNLEAAFDIDSYDDPDEFFAAFERHERAREEIMRQNGTVRDEQDQHKLKSTRPRRPGLLGRSYKNRFSESGIFQAEKVTEAYAALSNPSEQQDNRSELNDESHERDVTGSTKTRMENNEVLDELLSQNLEDLDVDGAVNLLQEHLQIKIIDVDNLELLDLQDIRKDYLNASLRSLSKKRPALLDIQNIMKEPDRNSPSKHRGGSSAKNYLSSKSATKSPLAQISLLKKRLFRESTSIDPFSSAHIDEVAQGNPLNLELSERHEDDVNRRINSELLNVPLGRQDVDVENEPISDNCMQKEIGNHNTNPQMVAACLDSSRNHFDDQKKEATTSSQPDSEMEESNAEEPNKDGDFLGPLVSSIVEEFAINGSSKCAEGVLEQQMEVLEHPMEEPRAPSPNKQNEFKSSSSSKARKRKIASPQNDSRAQKNLVVTECQPVNTADGAPEEFIEEPRAASPNKQNKVKSSSSSKERNRKVASPQSDFRAMKNPVVTQCQPVNTADGAVEEFVEEPRAASPNKQNEVKSSSSSKGRKRKVASPQNDSRAQENPVVTECQPVNRADGAPQEFIEEPGAASPNKQSEVKSRLSSKGQTRKVASLQNDSGAQNNPVVTECQPVNTADGASEEFIEKVSGEMHKDEGNNRPRSKRTRLKKELSNRRTSLADAGTAWASGVRRSTRIRSRPLAYWKGERFLYGRIHESLATVIGVKYESPGTSDGKRGLKVKSFVSDEYKELLDLVA